MKEKISAILTLIALIMFAIGVILVIIDLFDNSVSDATILRTKIYCFLMIGAVIIKGIAGLASGNNDKE